MPIAVGAISNPLLVWLTRKLEIITYRRAAHVVALAPGMRDDTVAKGIAPQKITVIPNGCDLDAFGSSTGPSPRGEHDWLLDRKLVRQTAALDPEIRFVVIGRGREWPAIRSLAMELGVYERSFFMLDAVPKKEVGRWLHAADVLMAVLTGPRIVWKDAVSNKFFDALAVGKPIANNFDGWQARVAIEADVGLILDAADYDAAARQLVGVLRDEAWRVAVPARARVLAEGRFHRDRLAAALEQVLVTAAGAREGPQRTFQREGRPSPY